MFDSPSLCKSSGFAYEALYAGVFGMDEKDIQNSLDQVIFVIDTDRIIYSDYILQMLRDKKFVRLKQRRKQLCYRSSSKTVHMPDELMSLPPVPYRVAKALDPAFYRNVEMDLWLQENEGRGTSGSEGPCGTPAISTRCLIASPHDPDRMLVCYVASKAQGFQVQVFVPSLQKR